MKTLVLIIATLLSAGMLMTSCQKNELIEPADQKTEPFTEGENYVPSSDGAPKFFNTASGASLNEPAEEDESNIGYMNIFPHRFTETANIEFEILRKVYVSLMILDASGNEVAHLVGGIKEKGVYNVELDGSGLPLGVYTARLWARHDEFVEQIEKIRNSRPAKPETY